MAVLHGPAGPDAAHDDPIWEFDELAIRLRVAGKIDGAVHPYVGQEAVAVGACAALTTATG